MSGLTTAASIWLVASLGTACGTGYWLAALAALVLALIVLILGGPVEGFLRRVFGKRDRGNSPLPLPRREAYDGSVLSSMKGAAR